MSFRSGARKLAEASARAYKARMCEVACPACKAAAGVMCVLRAGEFYEFLPHDERVQAWRAANAAKAGKA